MTPMPLFLPLRVIEYVLGQHPVKSGPQDNSYKESSTMASFGKPISRIRFCSQVPRFHNLDSSHARTRLEVCEFSLGLGPCGRTVTRLWYRVDGDFLKITQECADPLEGECEVKDFIYLIREISGRITATCM